MNFKEAMEKLTQGSKITRQPWIGSLYFMLEGEDVKSFQPRLTPYSYNEDIMVSDGWIVDDSQEEYKFSEIIPMLINGSKAKLKDWVNMFIYLDESSKSLVLHSMDVLPFIPPFESFIAQDWIEIE
jgi:hypothetical protein